MAEIEGFQHTINQRWTACNQPSICLLREELEVLKNEVADMIELELIIPSYGAWTKPMLFLQKKDGSFTLSSKALKYEKIHHFRNTINSKTPQQLVEAGSWESAMIRITVLKSSFLSIKLLFCWQ
jgi:hypothetical protein